MTCMTCMTVKGTSDLLKIMHAGCSQFANPRMGLLRGLAGLQAREQTDRGTAVRTGLRTRLGGACHPLVDGAPPLGPLEIRFYSQRVEAARRRSPPPAAPRVPCRCADGGGRLVHCWSCSIPEPPDLVGAIATTAAPAFSFSRSFNRDVEGTSAKWLCSIPEATAAHCNIDAGLQRRAVYIACTQPSVLLRTYCACYLLRSSRSLTRASLGYATTAVTLQLSPEFG